MGCLSQALFSEAARSNSLKNTVWTFSWAAATEDLSDRGGFLGQFACHIQIIATGNQAIFDADEIFGEGQGCLRSLERRFWPRDGHLYANQTRRRSWPRIRCALGQTRWKEQRELHGAIAVLPVRRRHRYGQPTVRYECSVDFKPARVLPVHCTATIDALTDSPLVHSGKRGD